MHNYKIVIAYDGTKYDGFQRQSDHPEKTIQGKLEKVLSLLFKHDIQIIGSGRTDSGVHAKGQVCNFHSPCLLPCDEILLYLAQYFPQDIAVLTLSMASPRFHARYNVLKKRYCYTIDNQLFANPFMTKYAYHVSSPLDVAKMRQAASFLIGTHDFKSFTSLKSKKKSTIRKIITIEIIQNDNLIKIFFEADGFLQHMVRIITGTLLDVGLGIKDPNDVMPILEQGQRALAGPTVPPYGLCMEKVYYD